MTESRAYLQSELIQLRSLLNELPEAAVIDRISIESRLRRVQERLEKLPLESRRSHTFLTFSGRPVDGSRGINAGFGSRAANSFADAHAAVVAGMKEDLRYMGPIPDRAAHDLLIVGTAVGSFGFEFELPPVDPDLLQHKSLEESSVELIRDLMEVSATGSDDEISDIVERVHRRAVKKVSEFLGLLAQHEALCSLSIGDKQFRYVNSDQLQASRAALAEDNIRESEENLYGAFLGVLPKSRNFEFELAESRDVIRGKISSDIENPETINEYVGQLVQVTFEKIQVGQGRPRFTLKSTEAISDR
ncbi:hypothetical protein [Rhodosalinus sediminis]|uniref:hypothetical protein n=1 Tax=Rhodosalinus sediminis TaxID=1940533 RepID=UPI0023520F94|nr:hypothetical protein [Rhodosalinus sediminis]